ncbi:hypothetical protein JCM10212_005295 [Sporobolomyces blumeae]
MSSDGAGDDTFDWTLPQPTERGPDPPLFPPHTPRPTLRSDDLAKAQNDDVDGLRRHSSDDFAISPVSTICPASPSPRFPFPSPARQPFSWSPAAIPSLALSPSLDHADQPQRCFGVDGFDGFDVGTNGRDGPFESPPSPLGIPGTFSNWTSARTSLRSNGEQATRQRRWDRHGSRDSAYEGELVLPPPFLDHRDDAVSRSSFAGVLGVRTARKKAKAERERAKLFAQGRAPPPPFPTSLVRGMSKLVAILGPPGGSEYLEGQRVGKDKMESIRGEKERRRVKRAETGLKAYEFGSTVGAMWADKLRRGTSYTEKGHDTRADSTSGGATEPGARVSSSTFVAATPSSFLGASPASIVDEPRLSSHLQDFPDHLDTSPPSAPLLQPFIPDSPFIPPLETPFALDRRSPKDYFSSRTQYSAPAGAGEAQRTDEAASDDKEGKTSRHDPVSSTTTTDSLKAEGLVNTVTQWIVWLLVGSPSRTSSASLDESVASLSGLVGIVVHLVGFAFFVLYNSATLVVSTISTVRQIGVFSYWAFLNLSGRTDVSRAVVAYWKTCREEWDRVCEQDEGGRAISTWSTAQGLAELAALQSMTRQDWLGDGPGELVLLNGDQDDLSSLDPSNEIPIPNPSRRSSVRKRRSSDARPVRPSFTKVQQSFRWDRDDGDDTDDRDGLVVTGHGGSVLEGTLIAPSPELRPRPARRKTSSPFLRSTSVGASDGTVSATDVLPLNLTSPALVPVPEENDPVADLVSQLKRYGRLSTASYGLHTYIVSPPTPLLTPSGATLPARLFAHIGGVDDYRNVLHVALQQRSEGSEAVAGNAYAPTFYLLRDDARGEIIVVFRGTQSLADLKTDLEGDSVPLRLPSLSYSANDEAATTDSSDETPYRIHAGILSAARHLLDPIESPLFAKLSASLLEHPKYDLALTGHSLGSALASTVCLLIGSFDSSTSTWTVSPDSGLPPGRSLRAFTFAHPTTLNAPLAERCAIGTPPLVVSVSLKSDVITRAGIPQLREVRRTLGRLERSRTDGARAHVDDGPRRRPRGAGGGILATWWAWRSSHAVVADAPSPDGSTARSDATTKAQQGTRAGHDDLVAFAWQERSRAEDWARECGRSDDDDGAGVETAVPAGKTYHLDRLPPELEARRRDEARRRSERTRSGVHDVDDHDDDAEDEAFLGLYEVKNPRAFYRLPILDSDLVKSHLPKEYLDAVESL